jgi:hypothetical protein
MRREAQLRESHVVEGELRDGLVSDPLRRLGIEERALRDAEHGEHGLEAVHRPEDLRATREILGRALGQRFARVAVQVDQGLEPDRALEVAVEVDLRHRFEIHGATNSMPGARGRIHGGHRCCSRTRGFWSPAC